MARKTIKSEEEQLLRKVRSTSNAALRRKIAVADQKAFIQRATFINQVNVYISQQEMAGMPVIIHPYSRDLRLIRAYEEKKVVCFLLALADPTLDQVPFSFTNVGPVEQTILSLLQQPSPVSQAAASRKREESWNCCLQICVRG